MVEISEVGQSILCKALPQSMIDKFDVEVVRTLEGYQKVVALRAVTFMGEQDCPFDEEYDGNDLCACHLLIHLDGEPIATLRLRWFADFGKIERVCIRRAYRGSGVVKVMIAAACELAARKGFRRMTAQIQARLWPLWSKTLHCKLMKDRASFFFSDYEYKEVVIPLTPHPKAIRMTSDPYEVIRPEGEWDSPGVLDASGCRGGELETVAA